RQPAVPLVIGFGGGERADGFVRTAEPEQAFRVWQDPAGPRVLHDGRPAACEVAERAIAHPCGLEGDGRRLRATPLATGSPDVGAIGVRGRADVPGFSEPPTFGLHQPAVLFVVLA